MTIPGGFDKIMWCGREKSMFVKRLNGKYRFRVAFEDANSDMRGFTFQVKQANTYKEAWGV